MPVQAKRYNWRRRGQIPLLIIDGLHHAVWRVWKRDHFLTFWYALQPGCEEGHARGEPFIDVRTLPAFDGAHDAQIWEWSRSTRVSEWDTRSHQMKASRSINDQRFYHAQVFAAAINAGIDLTAHAETERQKTLDRFALERAQAGPLLDDGEPF